MGVVNYFKRQFKTVIGSQFEEHSSKPHPSNYAHLVQLCWLLLPVIVL